MINSNLGFWRVIKGVIGECFSFFKTANTNQERLTFREGLEHALEHVLEHASEEIKKGFGKLELAPIGKELKKRFLMQVLATFGTEGLLKKEIKTLINDELEEGDVDFLEEGDVDSWSTALNPFKLLNPFKWLQFMYYLVTRWLLLPMLFLVALVGLTPLVLVPLLASIPMVGIGASLLLPPIVIVTTVTYRLAYVALKLIGHAADFLVNLMTSPVASFIAPLVDFFRYKRYQALFCTLIGLALATPIVLLIAFSGGALPASIVFMAPLAQLVAPVVAPVVSSLAGTGLGMLGAQILLGVGFSALIMAFTYHFYQKTMEWVKEVPGSIDEIIEKFDQKDLFSHTSLLAIAEVIDLLLGRPIVELVKFGKDQCENKADNQPMHQQLYGYEVSKNSKGNNAFYLEVEESNFRLKLFDALGVTNFAREPSGDVKKKQVDYHSSGPSSSPGPRPSSTD